VGTVSIALGLKKDTGRYLVGVHAGREFWFEKDKLEAWSAEPSGLQITIDAAAWERRLKSGRTAAEETVPSTGFKLRKCLVCKTPFSAHRVQYVCGPCKQTANWRDGESSFCAV